MIKYPGKFFQNRLFSVAAHPLIRSMVVLAGLACGLQTIYAQELSPIQKQDLPVGAVAGPIADIDLKYWKLTLPTNEKGALSGRGDAAKIIYLPGIAAPPYYRVTGSSLTFAAPTNGARTSGSNYPRSELREMDGEGQEYYWTLQDGGYLSATLRINEVPTTSKNEQGRVVIGQIHGPRDELCRLYYDNGKLYFVDDKAGSSRRETVFPLKTSTGAETKIGLGETFSYRIAATSDRLTVTVTHRGKKYSATDPISSFWPGKKLYFKAGIYVQVGKSGSSAGSTGVGQGSATFTALSRPRHDVFHAPAPRPAQSDEGEDND